MIWKYIFRLFQEWFMNLYQNYSTIHTRIIGKTWPQNFTVFSWAWPWTSRLEKIKLVVEVGPGFYVHVYVLQRSLVKNNREQSSKDQESKSEKNNEKVIPNCKITLTLLSQKFRETSILPKKITRNTFLVVCTHYTVWKFC